MNNWLTHGINIGVFSAIGFGLVQLVISQKGEASTEKESSTKAKSTQVDSAHYSDGPILAVGSNIPRTSRPVVETEEGTVYADFEKDIMEIKQSNERHGWTGINARSPQWLGKIAHNDAERDRLLNENLWIPKRELVYRKEGLADIAKKAEASGQSPSEIILPGFSGTEYKVTVLGFESTINEEGISEGFLSGHLEGKPESEVFLGYYGQRESGVISGSDVGGDIGYEPREDGQVLVNLIDLTALEFALSDAHCTSIYGSHEVGEANSEL